MRMRRCQRGKLKYNRQDREVMWGKEKLRTKQVCQSASSDWVWRNWIGETGILVWLQISTNALLDFLHLLLWITLFWFRLWQMKAWQSLSQTEIKPSKYNSKRGGSQKRVLLQSTQGNSWLPHSFFVQSANSLHSFIAKKRNIILL